MRFKKLARMIFKPALAAMLVLLAVTTASAAGTWSNGQAADVALGQGAFNTNASGTTASTMNGPYGVAVDPATGKLFVSDSSNNRILRFSSANANITGSPPEAVLGQADFVSGLANRGGTVAANTLRSPIGVFVDSAGRLWVGDEYNHRVLRFDNASTKATGADADGVLGQADFIHGAVNRGGAVAANTLDYPMGVGVDSSGRLWVDDGNHRVLRFDNAATKANGADADGVLGQTNFTTGTANTGGISASTMNSPIGMVVTNSGVLFVADTDNNRVLRFDNAAAKANGASADGVLGQANFTSSAAPNPPTQSSAKGPRLPAFEENGGRLFVPDTNNNRVLIFNNAVTKANGANADNVLGQTNFTTGTANTGGISASTLNNPRMSFFDNAANVLWQADGSNNRVLRYTPGASSTATAVTSSLNPSVVGQAVTFTASVSATSGFGTPTGTVQFKVDGTNLGAPVTLSSGSANTTTTSLSVGNHTVTAVYSAGAGFSASTGTLSGGQTVVNAQLLLPLVVR